MTLKTKTVCLFCGSTSIVPNGSGKFCSSACHADFRYSEFIKKWMSSEICGAHKSKRMYPSKHIYRWFRENVTACEICGIAEWRGMKLTLEMDHIDGDRTNASRGNLRLICPNCHSQTPTYRGKNRKNKRSV